jgi:Ala-tRNA(Pro) deacylase
VLAVLPADCKIDVQKVSQALGGAEVELATEAQVAEHCPDCEVGVLPPFGSQYGLQTIVDESLARQLEIVFEANNHHEAIRMSFEDYRRLENPTIISFSRR